MNAPAPSPKVPLPQWGTEPALDAFESIMWRLDRWPNLRSAVTSVELLDRVPDRARVCEAHEIGVKLIQRLRQRLVTSPLGIPEWCDDPDFSVNRHLRFVTLSEPGSLREALDVAQEFAMQDFDRQRPPWSAILIEGLADGRAAYVLKLHHAMSDGIGIVQLLSLLHGRNPDSLTAVLPAEESNRNPEPPASDLAFRQFRREAAKVRGQSKALWGQIRSEWAQLGGMRSRVSDAAAYASSLRRVLSPLTAPRSPLLAARNNQWRFETLEVPLDKLKQAAKRCRATLNDAFVSAVLGGFRNYHLHFGVELDEIPVTSPISIRSENDGGGGNRFAPGHLSGPIGEPSPVRRMDLVGDQMRRLRAEPALAGSLAVMNPISLLPTTLIAKAMSEKLAATDLQISNVPGMREDVYMAGAKVTHLFPFAPLPGCPAMVTLVSHGDLCCVGFNLDQAAISDPETFMEGMRDSFAEVLALASQ